MKRGNLIMVAGAGLASVVTGTATDTTAQTGAMPSFKAGIDLVRVSAVVRDRKGRFVQDLSGADFDILDSGERQAIADFHSDLAGVSVAMLFDVSGSMEGSMPRVREAATHLLSWLEPRDEA